MTQLTWDDLLIRNVTVEDASDWIAEWSELVSGRFHPVFLSKFGDWFIRRPGGTTDLLDVLEGKIRTIADSPDQFDRLVNDIAWQEEYLLSWLVYELHEDGIIPGHGQCYGLAPHPQFGGPINRANALILDIAVWQSICSQAFR